jgi:hypothetical protein
MSTSRPLSGVIRTLGRHRPRAEFDPISDIVPHRKEQDEQTRRIKPQLLHIEYLPISNLSSFNQPPR